MRVSGHEQQMLREAMLQQVIRRTDAEEAPLMAQVAGKEILEMLDTLPVYVPLNPDGTPWNPQHPDGTFEYLPGMDGPSW